MLHAWNTWNDKGYLETLLQTSRRALSMFQHHDAISGTARDEVVNDWANGMIKALRNCKFVIQQAAYRHLTKSSVSQFQI